ncbi:MAG: hypothetical protein LBC88_09430 [Spirochaetaceae bacterium]|jgi:hypothetical protein|nr:hypothetical protein [Spirochaetaceae bacterium]
MVIKTGGRREAAFFLFFFCTTSCVVTEKNVLSRRAPPEDIKDFSRTEDINGIFPRAVYIKTRTQTFNSYHYYILYEGRIWYKSIDPDRHPRTWTLFAGTGLPHRAGAGNFAGTGSVAELSADADELAALSPAGAFYRYCFDWSIAHRSGVWLDRQGWPGEEQLHLDERTRKNRSWALGKRNSHVLYYEDPFANQHHNGTMEIATTYMLLDDGQEICYADTGLPADFSRNFAGPERGAFRAAALSASASTIFVINSAGEMYTRLADFDVTGSDPMFFKYTYVPYRSGTPGTGYFSNLTAWGLPPEDWRPAPAIPLAGKAAITRHITILQNGQGNGAREMRVAGRDEAGETGYWTKAIFDDAWLFVRVPLFFDESAILVRAGDGVRRGERGASLDKEYAGFRWTGGERETKTEYRILNFNILEGDCDLRISRGGEECTVKLYPVEMWTYLKRDYLPGRTGAPKMFWVTLVVPDNALDGLSEDFARDLSRYTKNSRALFHYTIMAGNHYLLLRSSRGSNSVLFLTDGTVSDRYPDLKRTWYAENFEEVPRYYADELLVRAEMPVTREELLWKIEGNRIFLDELQRRIRLEKWARFVAFQFNAGYLPVHYVAMITPLRFLDVPKIRTITRFGKRIVLENSAYIDAVSDARIRICRRIIELLGVRILCYREMERKLAAAEGAAEITLPAWYADSVSAWWDIAGLPRRVRGTFTRSRRTAVSAVLSLMPPPSPMELSGWYFSASDSVPENETDGGFFIFLDPQKSIKTIYARRGKTPEEQPVRLNAALYVNGDASGVLERNIANRILKPLGAERGINVELVFDGRTFEMHESSPVRTGAPLFRGVPLPD